jgi:membrane protease YdiL (CAAX protease family)
MTDHAEVSERPPSAEEARPASTALLRQWDRLPAPLRSLLAGLFVFAVIQNGWFALLLVNLQVTPRVPWCVPVGLAWLWLSFRYFGGRGWPASTAARRRRGLRAAALTGSQWIWSAVFFVVFVAFLTSVVNTVYRFQVIPEEPYDLASLPWWTLYPVLVMVSLAAGVSEEAGFRGYLQGGLERRFGPAAAIAVTSVLFWLAHLNHADGAARWALLLAMAALLGALTWSAGSIRPAIACHAGIDTIFFVTGASVTAPWFFEQPPQLTDTGVDAPFVVFSLLLVASGAAAVFVLRRISAARRPAAVPASPPSPPGATGSPAL